jgi:hypothetical protein
VTESVCQIKHRTTRRPTEGIRIKLHLGTYILVLHTGEWPALRFGCFTPVTHRIRSCVVPRNNFDMVTKRKTLSIPGIEQRSPKLYGYWLNGSGHINKKHILINEFKINYTDSIVMPSSHLSFVIWYLSFVMVF